MANRSILSIKISELLNYARQVESILQLFCGYGMFENYQILLCIEAYFIRYLLRCVLLDTI